MLASGTEDFRLVISWTWTASPPTLTAWQKITDNDVAAGSIESKGMVLSPLQTICTALMALADTIIRPTLLSPAAIDYELEMFQ